MSTLYQQWQNIAYDETADRSQLEKFWGTYFQIEKEITKSFFLIRMKQ